MFCIMKDMNIWLKEKNWSDYSWDYELQYKAGQCIQCGCCLEICPNFLNGNGFSGAAAMVNAYKAMELNVKDEHSAEMKTEYAKKFLSYCGQSFSCKKVCPQNLPLDEIQARANHY